MHIFVWYYPSNCFLLKKNRRTQLIFNLPSNGTFHVSKAKYAEIDLTNGEQTKKNGSTNKEVQIEEANREEVLKPRFAPYHFLKTLSSLANRNHSYSIRITGRYTEEFRRVTLKIRNDENYFRNKLCHRIFL